MSEREGVSLVGLGLEWAQLVNILDFAKLGVEVDIEEKDLTANVVRILVVSATTRDEAFIELQVLIGFRHGANGC